METIGRPRCRWEDSIEIVFGGADWIDLAQDVSVAGTVRPGSFLKSSVDTCW
jgi:hypothetical protein